MMPVEKQMIIWKYSAIYFYYLQLVKMAEDIILASSRY